MSGFIVIGQGKAAGWSDDASAVEPRDEDLQKAARGAGLFETGQQKGVCDMDGNMLGDGWLLVGGDHVAESDLDADPSVIAYCKVAS